MSLSKKNPHDKYKHTEINTANQGKLIVMLYDGAIKFLNIAIANMEPKYYDQVNHSIIKAQDIITELMLSIKMVDKNDISQNLFNLYMYFKKRLLEANIQKDPEIIKEVIKYLKELREAWDKISAKETVDNAPNIDSKGSFSIEG